MATRKKAKTKTAGRKGQPQSTPAKARSRGCGNAAAGAKRRPRTFSEKRLRALLTTMLDQFSEQVTEKGVSYTNGDGFRLMQMMESLGLAKPSDVKVEWVEPKES
jgi:hypothetical protein